MLARELKYAAGRSLACKFLHVKGQTARYSQSILHQIAYHLPQASILGIVAASLHSEQLQICPPDARKSELVSQGLEKFPGRLPGQGTVLLPPAGRSRRSEMNGDVAQQLVIYHADRHDHFCRRDSIPSPKNSELTWSATSSSSENHRRAAIGRHGEGIH